MRTNKQIHKTDYNTVPCFRFRSTMPAAVAKTTTTVMMMRMMMMMIIIIIIIIITSCDFVAITSAADKGNNAHQFQGQMKKVKVTSQTNAETRSALLVLALVCLVTLTSVL